MQNGSHGGSHLHTLLHDGPILTLKGNKYARPMRPDDRHLATGVTLRCSPNTPRHIEYTNRLFLFHKQVSKILEPESHQ